MYPQLLQKFILPLGSLLFGGRFHKEIKKWEYFDSLSEEELTTIQQKRLKKMLEYAVARVPYYKSIGIKKDTPIHEWPILTKEILRKHHEDLISSEYSIDTLVKNYSSGSSGLQSFTYMTHEHRFLVRAIQTHWWKWGGFQPGERMLQAGMSPKRTFTKKLKDYFFRVHYMDAFTLNDSNIEATVTKFKRTNKQHIVGYPSALNEIAKYLIKNNKTLPFQSLISLGDKLFARYRKNFEKAFEKPIVINTYGCAEGYMVGCKFDIEAYYIMSPHVYIEIVDDDGNILPPGNRGQILITGLTNFAMPLVRYKVGDLGIIMPRDEYPENRKYCYPLLKELTGRETDVITCPNGIKLIVHSFTGIFEFYDSIKQFKIIQTSKSSILINYITDDDSILDKRIKNELLEKLDNLCKGSLKFKFEKVSFIPPSPSGKPQIVEIRYIES